MNNPTSTMKCVYFVIENDGYEVQAEWRNHGLPMSSDKPEYEKITYHSGGDYFFLKGCAERLAESRGVVLFDFASEQFVEALAKMEKH